MFSHFMCAYIVLKFNNKYSLSFLISYFMCAYIVLNLIINIHYYDLYFIQFHLYRKSKKRIKFSYDYPDNSPLMGPP
jgi:hypothetical protein